MGNKRLISVCLAVATAALVSEVSTATRSTRFFGDDPLAREPESQDASRAETSNIGEMYEMVYNLFANARYKPSGVRAQNINTIDEVPDSSWFTNRIGTKMLTIDELVRGPNVGAPPDPSRWVIVREKASGVHPGLTAKDAKGEMWFLQFDPKYYPEGATASLMMATRLFWALGYNQVETFLTTFDPKHVELDPEATIKRPNGKRTSFTDDDLNAILERVARRPDGTYRVAAGRLLPGKVLGNFRYQGTRPDDPNDVVPHEHRRELRALRVFGAWTNLTDLKSANTLDTLVPENDRLVVKHWLQDVGSTFGMNNDLHEWDLSWEHFYQGDTTLKRLASFGFALSRWQTVDYVEKPSIGKFEGDRFDPRTWRPQTPTTAYMELRDDDAFWAARRVAAFNPEMIAAIIHTGQLSDPTAEEALVGIMLKRRDKILHEYLLAMNPIVSPRLGEHELTFENAAVDADLAQAPQRYRATWFEFDNATGALRALGETDGNSTGMDAPADLPSRMDSVVAVDLSADGTDYEGWRRPIRAYFRRQTDGWKLVGLDRLPEESVTQVASRR